MNKSENLSIISQSTRLKLKMHLKINGINACNLSRMLGYQDNYIAQYILGRMPLKEADLESINKTLHTDFPVDDTVKPKVL